MSQYVSKGSLYAVAGGSRPSSPDCSPSSLDRFREPYLKGFRPHGFGPLEHLPEPRIGLGQLAADVVQRRDGNREHDLVEVRPSSQFLGAGLGAAELFLVRRRRPAPPVADPLDWVVRLRPGGHGCLSDQLDGVDDREPGHQPKLSHSREELKLHSALVGARDTAARTRRRPSRLASAT